MTVFKLEIKKKMVVWKDMRHAREEEAAEEWEGQ